MAKRKTVAVKVEEKAPTVPQHLKRSDPRAAKIEGKPTFPDQQ